jgi:hypothetical protein
LNERWETDTIVDVIELDGTWHVTRWLLVATQRRHFGGGVQGDDGLPKCRTDLRNELGPQISSGVQPSQIS